MQTPVAIYTRISEDRQGKEEGVARQLQDCRELADRLGLSVVAVKQDNNRSAYSKNAPRPEWDQLKELIRAGAIKGVVVWHTDRLYRHPSHLEDIIELVESNGLTIYTVTAGEIDLNTPTGRMVARLLGSVARNEVEHKAERQQRAHLELARQGRWHGGPTPLGFQRVDGKTGELELHPVEAPALREAADRILDGFSLSSTAKWFSTQTKRHIDPRRLRAALTGPKMVSLRMHIPQDDRDKWAGHRARRTVSGDLPPQVTTYPAQWPSILDEDSWIKVKAILLDPARKTNSGRPVKSLLGGLVYCTCGHVMSRSTTTYHCHTGSGKDACGKVAISSNALEGLIKDAMTARAERSEGFDVGTTEMHDTPVADMEPLEQRRAEVLDLHSEGIITKAEMIRQLDRLNAKLNLIEEARAEGIRRDIESRSLVHGPEYWARLREAVDAMDRKNPDEDLLSEARRFISRVILRIEVSPSPAGSRSGPRFNPERVVVEWKQKRPSEALSGPSDAI